MNLGHALVRAARHHPDALALVGRGTDGLTYAALADRVERIAGGLALRGIGRGDRVGVLLRNHAAFVEITFALYRLGAVVVPFNAMLTPGEHDELFEDADVAALIVGGGFADHCAAMSVRPDRCVVVDGPTDGFAAGAEPYGALLDASPAPVADVDGEDLCALMYTSGTTGRPKGVRHTHGTWLATALGLKDALSLGADDVTLHVAPLTHGSGFVLLPTVLAGGTNVVRDGFDPASFLDAVERRGVTNVFLAPTMVYKLLDEYDGGRDTSSLRALYYAGSPMSAARLAEGVETFGPVFVQSYGQMECPMLITLLDAATHEASLGEREELLRSAGREVDIARVRIVDENDDEVPPGTPGEILVEGPHVTPGYWNRPEADDEAFHDGWLRTGDVGRLDEDGYLFVLDRKKDMIITGGMNVYPREVEEVIVGHGAVSNAAVIGVPDDYWGERVTAVVEPRPDGDLSPEALVEAVERRCGEELAAFKRPKRVEVVDELPRSPYGKVQKTALREEYWADRDRNVN
ncbi:long-chain fatty acid--CoA ligase [Halomarina halobia]|uniref:Long-chain fatty acid--CoA ligase n=1 Tax=Halomarina halobia TaxID=3033386 RepID=A0ABD6AD57_9EURY|nr:long-chain fatty acid--CoA ligase [Halomarina sp. PSR21]